MEIIGHGENRKFGFTFLLIISVLLKQKEITLSNTNKVLENIVSIIRASFICLASGNGTSLMM
jgi:hypothetical protein